MRLDKRHRRALKEVKRQIRLQRQRAAKMEGQAPIHGSLSKAVPSAGTSKPGAELFRIEKRSEAPKYSVERLSRIKNLEGRVIGGKVVSRSVTKRFANV